MRRDGDTHRHQGRGLQNLDITEVGGVEQHAAKAAVLKEHFDDDDLGQQPVEFEKNERDRDDQRVPEGMRQDDAPIRQSLQYRCADVL